MIKIVKKKINMSDELRRQYHRAKTEDKKSEILTEINNIQPKIKELQ